MFACCQERKLLMMPSLSIRVSAPDRNMGKQLWDSSLHVADEAEQSIGFKHLKWEFPIAVNACAANC